MNNDDESLYDDSLFAFSKTVFGVGMTRANHFVAPFSRIKSKSETAIWSNGWSEHSVTEIYNFQTAHRITARPS
jgi:hypothetical protein